MINFTITELQREVADLPPYGFFSLDKDSGRPALFYDFVCDKDFQIDSERFECFDAHVGSGWMELGAIDTLDEVNQMIARGEIERLRYLVLA
jgi:hypothetical protein